MIEYLTNRRVRTPETRRRKHNEHVTLVPSIFVDDFSHPKSSSRSLRNASFSARSFAFSASSARTRARKEVSSASASALSSKLRRRSASLAISRLSSNAFTSSVKRKQTIKNRIELEEHTRSNRSRHDAALFRRFGFVVGHNCRIGWRQRFSLERRRCRIV